MELATPSDPTGPLNLLECFDWPATFLETLAEHYGTHMVVKQLQRWRWSVTTCFSGVGCAETVLSFVLLANSAPRRMPCKILDGLAFTAEALHCLENASREFLLEHCSLLGYNKKHVALESSCDINQWCRHVLGATYPCTCCFGDVNDLKKKQAWCYTHDKKCPVRKPASLRDGRDTPAL